MKTHDAKTKKNKRVLTSYDFSFIPLILVLKKLVIVFGDEEIAMENKIEESEEVRNEIISQNKIRGRRIRTVSGKRNAICEYCEY